MSPGFPISTAAATTRADVRSVHAGADGRPAAANPSRARSLRRLTGTIALLVAMALVGLPAPAQAAGSPTVRIQGVGYPVDHLDEEHECWHPDSDVTLAFEGDLQGCLWATIADDAWLPSAGIYQERGTEVFEGCLHAGTPDERCGTFSTTYLVVAKWEPGEHLDPASQVQQWGMCIHPVIDGSGEDGFAGVRGRFRINDDVEAGTYPYRGHLTFR